VSAPRRDRCVEIPRHGVLFVNSSIAAFTETVRVVLERFPYYDEDAELDEVHAAARDLADLIRRIDPKAMRVDRFWSTLVDDVEMGDFATQPGEHQGVCCQSSAARGRPARDRLRCRGELGGPTFRGMSDKTPYRMFWWAW
jgi:hypothetical protein